MLPVASERSIAIGTPLSSTRARSGMKPTFPRTLGSTIGQAIAGGSLPLKGGGQEGVGPAPCQLTDSGTVAAKVKVTYQRLSDSSIIRSLDCRVSATIL